MSLQIRVNLITLPQRQSSGKLCVNYPLTLLRLQVVAEQGYEKLTILLISVPACQLDKCNMRC